MGKNLKGKELGTGLNQRTDGKYIARYTTKYGKRIEQRFDKLQDARVWLEESKYTDKYGKVYSEITLEKYYERWFEEKKKRIKATTIKNYENDWKKVDNELKSMKLKDITTMNIEDTLSNIQYITSKHSVYKKLHTIFDSAVEKNLIERNPANKSILIENHDGTEKRILTVEEQKKFISSFGHNKYADLYVLCLNTGLRIGELSGLAWDNISFEKREIYVVRNIEYLDHKYVVQTPKTKSGLRTVPINDVAMDILKKRHKSNRLKVVNIEYGDLVFFTRNENPIIACGIKQVLDLYCKKIGIEQITMHGLRHTFATRCIENGMTPKTLQKILGHRSLKMTMDLYVHVTDDTLHEEIKKLKIM